MRWKGRRSSQNVEDRRSVSRPAMAGGGVIGLLMIVLVIYLGGDPMPLLKQMANNPPAQQQGPVRVDPAEAELAEFVSVVLADTETVWQNIFRQRGNRYQEPHLVLFRGRVSSACGFSSASTGPFYCPGDAKGYLDLSFFDYTTLSVDYYDIEITDIIGEFSAQEILDACYGSGQAGECAKIDRIAGDLTISGAGINLLTTNLDYLQAEGIDVGFNFGFAIGKYGNLDFSGNITKYLTQESQSSSRVPVIDCKGYYGTTCDPISDIRWTQRTTWTYDAFTVSALWRHLGSMDVEKPEAANVYAPFQKIDSYDYIDLYASYQLSWNGDFTISVGVDNVTEEDAPIVGADAGDTSYNSGNTFPSSYDVIGRMYSFNLNYKY